MAHEFDGEKYEQTSEHQKEWGSKLISELNLRGRERILDLGCGDGVLTVKLAKLVPHGEVLGIDASEGMIKVARKKSAPNLSFACMNIDRLNFLDAFDVVFSNATLHWVLDHTRLLRNVKQALKGGGVLRFNFGGKGNCANFIKVIREAMSLESFAGYFNDFAWPWFMPPPEEYRKLVEEAGFREARVWSENADRNFPTDTAIVGWIDQPSIVPFLAHVEEKNRAAFREYVVGRMLEVTPTPDGSYFETFRRINVFARKQPIKSRFAPGPPTFFRTGRWKTPAKFLGYWR